MTDHKPYADSKQARELDEALERDWSKPRPQTGTYKDSPEKLARFEAYRASRNHHIPLSERIAVVINARRVLKTDV